MKYTISSLRAKIAELTAPQRQTQGFFALKAMSAKQANIEYPDPFPLNRDRPRAWQKPPVMARPMIHETKGPNRRDRRAGRVPQGPYAKNKPYKKVVSEC